MFPFALAVLFILRQINLTLVSTSCNMIKIIIRHATIIDTLTCCSETRILWLDYSIENYNKNHRPFLSFEMHGKNV